MGSADEFPKCACNLRVRFDEGDAKESTFLSNLCCVLKDCGNSSGRHHSDAADQSLY